MGTSRNLRSPAELRWRVVQAAYGGGSAPRAVSELFRAAGRDGWLESLASPTSAAYAQAAVSATVRLSDLLLDTQTTGAAVRSLVDEARLAALDSPGFPQVGLITGLAERALTRVLVLRLQAPGMPLSATPPSIARIRWREGITQPPVLAVEHLAETVRQIVLHLVHRDGPQLVGGRVGGSSDVSDLARALADSAARVASDAVPMLRDVGLRAWPDASEAAWTAAEDLVQSAESLKDKFQW